MKKAGTKLTRRDYLKLSILSSGALMFQGQVFGALKSPNSKMNIALIGGGGIARSCYVDCRPENVIAIADVDDISGARGFEEFPKAKRYKDFRKMLDKHYKELDLVIVNTPDHTHFPATIDAMQRGIAVHVQKPLTHNIWEARTLQAAAKKFNLQTVMGNQGHNYEGMRQIKDWVDAGIIGDVVEVHAWTNRTSTNVSNALKTFPAEPIPAELDWDLWLGPAADRDYNSDFVPKGWRWHWEYGLGALGDIGCHTMDIPFYSFGLTYPEKVTFHESLDFRKEWDGKEAHQDGGTYIYEIPKSGKVPAYKLYWYDGGRMPKFPKEVHAEPEEIKKELSNGCLIVGTKNTILSPGLRPSNPKLLHHWEDIKRNPPAQNTPRAVGNPVQEIMAAIRGDIPKCSSNFDFAVPLTEIVLLGIVAVRSGKEVKYDPKTMSFSDSSLDKYIKEPVRKGWEYGEGIL